MPREGAKRLVADNRSEPGQIPEFEGAVQAAGQRGPAVGRKRGRSDVVRVLPEGVEFVTGRDLPLPERVVAAAGQRGATVGRKRGRKDECRMPLEGAQLLAGRQFP